MVVPASLCINLLGWPLQPEIRILPWSLKLPTDESFPPIVSVTRQKPHGPIFANTSNRPVPDSDLVWFTGTGES